MRRKRQTILESEHAVLNEKQLSGVVGAFEGAGYSSTGLYRPIARLPHVFAQPHGF